MSSKSDIALLYYPDEIPLLHTLLPILLSPHRKRFRFYTNPQTLLEQFRGDTVCVLRYAKFRRTMEDASGLLVELRRRFSRLVVIDDNAGSGQLDAEALRLCDVYFKKQMYRDRNMYLEPVLSGRYYLQEYANAGLINPGTPQPQVQRSEDLDKLRLLWNIGIGAYPRTHVKKRLARVAQRMNREQWLRFLYSPNSFPKDFRNRRQEVSARFGMTFLAKGIEFHRHLFLDKAAEDDRFLTGKATLREYNRELREIRATLSPYGYGEVCLRDFEAVLSGSVLIKPDMSYIETWPNIYKPWETYVPCRRDGSDVLQVTDRVLLDSAEAESIALQAAAVMREAWQHLPERVDSVVQNIIG